MCGWLQPPVKGQQQSTQQHGDEMCPRSFQRMDNSKIENQIENAILKNKTIRKELKSSMKIDDLGTHFDP